MAQDLRWVPLIGMTTEEMRSCMSKSKVYIDFGNHPGKDRIPREAAIFRLYRYHWKEGCRGIRGGCMYSGNI